MPPPTPFSWAPLISLDDLARSDLKPPPDRPNVIGKALDEEAANWGGLLGSQDVCFSLIARGAKERVSLHLGGNRMRGNCR